MQVKHKNCNACNLAKDARTVCIRGYGSDNPKIIVFLDNPSHEEDCRHESGSSKGITFIKWLFKRMSIPPSEYRVEFSLRCHAESDAIKTKEKYSPLIEACSLHQFATLHKYSNAILIGMGSLTCFLFLGNQKHGDYAGCDWSFKFKGKDRNVWITYSPSVVYQSPSDSVAIYRVFWKACEQAGLKPRFNNQIKSFNFEQ